MAQVSSCSVVIPHLAGTRTLLASLASLEPPAAGVPRPVVIVVDNGSSDGSTARARELFPDLVVVEAGRNLGYAGGCNLGLARVRTPWCVFLNDDAVLAPGALAALLARLEQAGPGARLVVQPTLRASAEPWRFDYAGAAGGLLDAWGYAFAAGRIFEVCETDDGQYRRSGPLAWASGCCLAGPTALLRELGGFEEAFFAHYEEIDLCWRLRRSGGQVRAVPQAVVYHLGPSTLPAGSRKTYLNMRNSLWTLRRNLPAAALAGRLCGRALLDGAAALRFLLQGRPGQAGAVLRGWGAGLLAGPGQPPLPARSHQQPGRREGTYRGSIAAAHFLRRVKRASQLRHRIGGWREAGDD